LHSVYYRAKEKKRNYDTQIRLKTDTNYLYCYVLGILLKIISNKMTVLSLVHIYQTRICYETTGFGLAYQGINRL
jgi:hypothetical protein